MFSATSLDLEWEMQIQLITRQMILWIPMKREHGYEAEKPFLPVLTHGEVFPCTPFIYTTM
jgi:hypothetical protein